MLNLTWPSLNFHKMFILSLGGVKKISLRNRLLSELPMLSEANDRYVFKARVGLFNEIKRDYIDLHKTGLGSLTQKEITNIYEYYFSQKKPGSYYYNLIKISSEDTCPYCGGVGFVSSLDHFLPKSLFPSFVLTPANLVPSCLECNQIKRDKLNANDSDLIHPYFDKNLINQKWIQCQVVKYNPLEVNFYVDAPWDWSVEMKNIVASHFYFFKLNLKYQTQSAKELTRLRYLRATSLKKMSGYDFSLHLTEVASSVTQDPLFTKNDWKATLYNCLAQDEQICFGRQWL